jgi:hypothetical protein
MLLKIFDDVIGEATIAGPETASAKDIARCADVPAAGRSALAFQPLLDFI